MKSRHISILDFFKQLQIEYFCAELRYKIYTPQSDKDYWYTIMRHKKNKIEDISLRNNLVSIFSDKNEYEKISKEVLKFGIPKFVYRDYYQQTKLKNRDLYFYFQPGSDVRVIIDEDFFVGKILRYDTKENIVFVGIDNITHKLKFEQICRIV